MNYWLFPCDPKQYDFHGAFEKLGQVDWQQYVKKISIGDIVFIYVGKPFSSIELVCEVVDVNIPRQNRNDEDKVFFKNQVLPFKFNAREFTRLKIVKWTNISLQELKYNGLMGNVQGQRTFDGRLLEYLFNQINRLNHK